ncbi:MAG: hypothetical protein KKD69_03760 [Euryarchaeota archaeon]|nr:hypothetical protein [Euryarchaeota archaeon]MBU4491560.1 hypothetical protein [Euryarchaeota archaeon]MCG2727612.1 hypothetical protein [Candidatus Methanoperedenaceae archaeon]
MKGEFVEYLKSIGITTQVMHNRIETIYEVCSEICPDEIVDIFVDEYIKEDGSREYEDLNFFSDTYQFGAKQFLTKDDYGIARIKKKVLLSKIQMQNYDFKKATEKSRLYLEVKFEGELNASFKASKENCDFLRDIILKYYKPNFKD